VATNTHKEAQKNNKNVAWVMPALLSQWSATERSNAKTWLRGVVSRPLDI